MPMDGGKNSVIAYYKWLQEHKGFWIFKLEIFKRNQQLKTFLVATYVYVYIDIYIYMGIF